MHIEINADKMKCLLADTTWIIYKYTALRDKKILN